MKGLWIEIRTGRDHMPITIMGKTNSVWVKLIYYHSNQIELEIKQP